MPFCRLDKGGFGRSDTGVGYCESDGWRQAIGGILVEAAVASVVKPEQGPGRNGPLAQLGGERACAIVVQQDILHSKGYRRCAAFQQGVLHPLGAGRTSQLDAVHVQDTAAGHPEQSLVVPSRTRWCFHIVQIQPMRVNTGVIQQVDIPVRALAFRAAADHGNTALQCPDVAGAVVRTAGDQGGIIGGYQVIGIVAPGSKYLIAHGGSGVGHPQALFLGGNDNVHQVVQPAVKVNAVAISAHIKPLKHAPGPGGIDGVALAGRGVFDGQVGDVQPRALGSTEEQRGVNSTAAVDVIICRNRVGGLSGLAQHRLAHLLPPKRQAHAESVPAFSGSAHCGGAGFNLSVQGAGDNVCPGREVNGAPPGGHGVVDCRLNGRRIVCTAVTFCSVIFYIYTRKSTGNIYRNCT